MESSLFITGSSGFIATNFLRKIKTEDYKNIYCLSRNESKTITSLSKHNNFKFIKGSIFDAELYKPYLAFADTVIHFAAITGKADPEEYFNTNAKGTEFLIKQCERLNIKNFLYISSIAVKFKDISRYYYAQSKKKAEDAVRNSKLRFTIVRPTIVIGRGSPILESFLKLTKPPVALIFGDGMTRIQPIYIDDLSDCLFTIINENIFLNKEYDLGGPEVITLEEFIKKVKQIYFSKRLKAIHIPFGLVVPIVSFLERFFYSHMPFNVGQLSSFFYEGTIEDNEIFLRHLPGMKKVDEMLMLAIKNE